jgi:hypothetical protein
VEVVRGVENVFGVAVEIQEDFVALVVFLAWFEQTGNMEG